MIMNEDRDIKKSILIIDTPENCFECRFSNQNPYFPVCKIMEKIIKTNKNRMDYCPFKPFPNYAFEWNESEGLSFENGYNECLDDILRGTYE